VGRIIYTSFVAPKVFRKCPQNFCQILFSILDISNSVCPLNIVNVVKYRIKDATYGDSGTQYGLFRAWTSEICKATGHFVIVEKLTGSSWQNITWYM
jgi:hypothetical protein